MHSKSQNDKNTQHQNWFQNLIMNSMHLTFRFNQKYNHFVSSCVFNFFAIFICSLIHLITKCVTRANIWTKYKIRSVLSMSNFNIHSYGPDCDRLHIIPPSEKKRLNSILKSNSSQTMGFFLKFFIPINKSSIRSCFRINFFCFSFLCVCVVHRVMDNE